MNKLLLIAGVAITTAGISSSVIAAQANGSSTAKVLQPMTITTGTDLAFGDIAAGAAAGSVQIGADGTVTNSTVTSSGTQTPGDFALTGVTGKLYTVDFGAASITLTGANIGQTMTVSGFVHDGGINGDLTLDAGNIDTLSIGATVAVGINQAADDYTGSYSVTVDYQ